MRTLVLTALSAALLCASPAFAKPTADETAAAREHYKRGTTLYDLGKYDEAIVEFQQAYEIKDDPVLLYNIAQSFRLSGKYSEALRFYRTYVRKKPDARNKEEVEQKIADMEALIQQQQRVQTMPSVDAIPPKGDRASSIGAKPRPDNPPNNEVSRTESAFGTHAETPPARTETPPETNNPPSENKAETPPETKTETPPVATNNGATTEDQPKPGKTKLIAGIVVAAVGVAALGAGIGLGAVAAGDSSTQEKNKVFDPSLDSQGKTFSTVGLVLDIVGGVAIAGGVVVAVLGVLQNRGGQEKAVSFIPTVGKNGAGAAFQLRF